jgi:microcystin-dependent protein
MKSLVTRHPSLVTALLLAICAAAQMAAAAPAAFSYQGVLRDGQGAALATKNQTVQFRLYAQGEGGSPIWGRAVAVLLDDNGLFSTELSDAAGSAINGVTGSGLASILANNAGNALYIGLTVVGTSGEIAPRQTILPVPYAIVAGDVASVSGDLPVSGQLTASSAEVSGTLRAGSLDVADGVAASTLTVSGDASVGGDISVAGTLGGYGAAPIGCIILWSGSSSAIPDGWALCDGQSHNGRTTPDLRDRFVVGAGGAYNVGNKGGENTHKLTVSEMPSHNHSYNFTGADLKGSWDNDNYFFDRSEHYPNNNNTAYTDYTGGNQPHENRPPFYALCYIMRVR